MIRILVAGDVRLYREGLAHELARRPQMEIVGCASGRAEVLSLLAALAVDVLLLDMAMPESIATLRDIGRAASAVRVVALAVPEVEPAVMACAEAGIAGYVARDGSLEQLVDAVHHAARGESLLPPRFAATLLRRVSALAGHEAPRKAPPLLTDRELEIASLVAMGLSNKQIAARLCIEVPTVKNHVHSILEKLHADRRGEISLRLRQADRPVATTFDFALRPAEPVR